MFYHSILTLYIMFSALHRTYMYQCSVSTVSQKNPHLRGPDIFSFFSQTVDNFKSDFYTPIIRSYARLQIFIQLSPTLTKLCHIKHNYPVHIICSKCPPSAETHAFRRLRKSLIALLIVVCGKSL